MPPMPAQSSVLVVITAIVAVTAIELMALAKGIDGAILAASLTIIGGLAGWRVGKGKKRG